MDLDLVSLFSNTTPAMAFGILAFWFNRRDHADMLRREQAYSAQLAAIIEQQMEQTEKRTDAIVRLERRVHDMSNALHRLGQALDPAWRGMARREGDDNA